MIQNVKQGEKITANLTNQLINACNGIGIPSQAFTNTPTGTLIENNYSWSSVRQSLPNEHIFQIRYAGTLVLEDFDSKQYSNKQTKTYFIFLGKSVADIKSQIFENTTEIGIITQRITKKIDDAMLDAHTKNGYFDSQVEGNDLYCILLEAKDEKDKSKPPKYYIVISDSLNVEDAAKQLFGGGEEEEQLKFKTVDSYKLAWQDDKKKTYVSQRCGFFGVGDDGGATISCDSQSLSSILSSMGWDENGNLELFEFSKDGTSLDKVKSMPELWQPEWQEFISRYYNTNWLENYEDLRIPFSICKEYDPQHSITQFPRLTCDNITKTPTFNEEKTLDEDSHKVRYVEQAIQLMPPLLPDGKASDVYYSYNLGSRSLEIANKDAENPIKSYIQLADFDNPDKTHGSLLINLEYGQTTTLGENVDVLTRAKIPELTSLGYSDIQIYLPQPPDPPPQPPPYEDPWPAINELSATLSSVINDLANHEERIRALEQQQCWMTGGDDTTCQGSRIMIGQTTLDESQLQRLLNLVT